MEEAVIMADQLKELRTKDVLLWQRVSVGDVPSAYQKWLTISEWVLHKLGCGGPWY